MEPTAIPEVALLIAGGPVQLARDGSILYSRAAPHGIFVHVLGQTELELLTSDDDLVKGIGDDFTIEGKGSNGAPILRFQWFFPQSRAVFDLGDNRILNVVRLFDEQRSVWEIYSRTGELVDRAVIDRAYEPWGLTRRGKILASYVDPATDEFIAVELNLRFDP